MHYGGSFVNPSFLFFIPLNVEWQYYFLFVSLFTMLNAMAIGVISQNGESIFNKFLFSIFMFNIVITSLLYTVCLSKAGITLSNKVNKGFILSFIVLIIALLILVSIYAFDSISSTELFFGLFSTFYLLLICCVSVTFIFGRKRDYVVKKKKASPKKVSPKKRSPKKVSPKKRSPKKVSPKKRDLLKK
jgi:hypothetical protein